MADSVVGRLIYKITGDLSDIKQSLTNTEKRIKSFSKLVQSAAGLFGVVAAFKSLINIVKGSVSEYLEAEESATKLAAALKTSGEYSTTTFERMKDLSSELQQVTRYGDDATQSALALLMSLGGMSSRLAGDLIPHVQDFASAMGMDLDSAATLVAKAIEGNVGALSRYGIKIQEGMDKQGRMAAITEQLEGKFGGLARAMGDTAGGAIIRLQNAFSDMQEEVGRATVTSLQPLVGWLANVATKISGIMKASSDLKQALANQAKGIADTNDELVIANAKYGETSKKIKEIEEGIKDAATYQKYYTEAQAAGAKGIDDYLVILRKRATEERRAINALEDRAEAEVKAEEKAAEAVRAEQEYADKVAAAYAKTEEGQRIALENDIKYWESALKVAGASKAKVVAILEDLRAEYAKKFPEPEAPKSGYYESKKKQLMKFENADEAYYDSVLQHEKAVAQAEQQRLEDEGEAVLERRERMRGYNNIAARINEELAKDEQETADEIKKIRESTWSFTTGLLDALSDLQQATLNRELAELEAKQKRELEAFEGTEEQRAELIAGFEKEKARIEFDAAMRSWQLQLASAIVSGAKAILAAWELGPIAGPIAAAMTGVMTAVQLAAIRQAKPVPSFAVGADFTVPPGYPNDSFPMAVESGEHVTVTPAGEGGELIHVIVNLDSRPILDTVAQASRDRRLLISARSVVP